MLPPSGGTAGDSSSGGASAIAGAPSAGGEAGAAGADGAGGEASAPICIQCGILPAVLPGPCGKDPYAFALNIRDGGVAPFQWQVSATAGAWHTEDRPSSPDRSEVMLVGEPQGAAELKVTATDAEGKLTERRYSIAPRKACYFAYVAPGPSGPKLAVRDPWLFVDATDKLSNNQGVSDFQFSPDGRLLAYRYGEASGDPNGAHLSVLDLTTMQDHALDFQEDAVTGYAWSPDAAALAVAFRAGGESILGGARLSFAGAGAQISPLAPLLTPYPYESNLLWVAPNMVSYATPATLDLGAPPGRSCIVFTSLGARGFGEPIPVTDFFYRPGFQTSAAPGGLFVNSPKDNRSLFNSAEGFFAVDHQRNFVDPAGRFSASVPNKTLTLVEASNGFDTFETSGNTPTSNCPRLLAWARDRERIACVADVSQADVSWGEIRFFDVASTTPLELAPTILRGFCLKDAQGAPLGGSCARSEYDYNESTSVAQPRLLSASGRWFAFLRAAKSGELLGSGESAAGYIHWANLDGPAPALLNKFGVLGTAPGAPIALAFSPSERFLLHQNGAQLRSHYLSTTPSTDPGIDIAVSGVVAPTTAPCADDYAGAASRWCGGANGSPSFVWSPDSAVDVLAYRTVDKLIVGQLSPTTFDQYEIAALPCDATCSGQFAFQPPIP